MNIWTPGFTCSSEEKKRRGHVKTKKRALKKKEEATMLTTPKRMSDGSATISRNPQIPGGWLSWMGIYRTKISSTGDEWMNWYDEWTLQ